MVSPSLLTNVISDSIVIVSYKCIGSIASAAVCGRSISENRSPARVCGSSPQICALELELSADLVL